MEWLRRYSTRSKFRGVGVNYPPLPLVTQKRFVLIFLILPGAACAPIPELPCCPDLPGGVAACPPRGVAAEGARPPAGEEAARPFANRRIRWWPRESEVESCASCRGIGRNSLCVRRRSGRSHLPALRRRSGRSHLPALPRPRPPHRAQAPPRSHPHLLCATPTTTAAPSPAHERRVEPRALLLPRAPATCSAHERPPAMCFATSHERRPGHEHRRVCFFFFPF
jgi:hypothetical protein